MRSTKFDWTVLRPGDREPPVSEPL